MVSLRLRTSWYLTLPQQITRRTVLQKVRGRTLNRASTACKHRVSGSFSLRSRGSFHLSFTVLYAIGHRGVFRLGGWSPRFPTRFLVSRGTLDPARLHLDFAYGIITLFDNSFQSFQLSAFLPQRSPQPQDINILVWPVSLSLATTQEIDFSFSSCRYLDVSVPCVPFL